jgi:putative ABC transport system substrate-binding protein
MKRREIGVLVAFAVLTVPTGLAAQRLQSARFGILHDSVRNPAFFNAMFQRLGELGWVEGRDLKVEFLTLDPELKQSAEKVRELARLKCDVILATNTPAAMAVKANAPTTPLVFIIGGDPVDLGLVSSLSRPGGNATGYLQESHEIILKQLSLLRELAPTCRRIAVMFEAGNPSMMKGVQRLQAAAGNAGLVVESIPLHHWKDVNAAHLKLRREPVDGLIVMYDRITSESAWNIAVFVEQLRLPAVYGSRFFVENGAVVSYGIDWPALLVRSAEYVARILGGTRPADLPVLLPSHFELVVNLHKARRVGQTIPESVLLQATEVIQ